MDIRRPQTLSHCVKMSQLRIFFLSPVSSLSLGYFGPVVISLFHIFLPLRQVVSTENIFHFHLDILVRLLHISRFHFNLTYSYMFQPAINSSSRVPLPSACGARAVPPTLKKHSVLQCLCLQEFHRVCKSEPSSCLRSFSFVSPST